MKRILALISSFFILQQFIAQDFLGYSASEYAGVTAIDIQPANLADNRFRFDMTLFAVSTKAYNNYWGIKRYGLKNKNSRLLQYEPVFSSSGLNGDQIKANYYETDDGGKSKSVYFSNRIVLPSFLLEINHKNSLAFTWDIRNYVNIDGVSPELARLAYTDYKAQDLWPKQLKATNLSAQAMSWAEYGVTYARVLKEDNQHAFKAAGRFKIMQGLVAAYMFAENFSYQFPSDTTMSIFNTNVEYGHSSNLTGTNELKYKWVSNPGFGFDLGFVYEWRPEYEKYKYELDGEKNLWRRDKSKYKLKAGLSILDIGGIKFTKGQYSGNFKADVNVMDFRDKFNFSGPGVIVAGDTSSLNFNAIDDSLLSLDPDKKFDDDKRTFFMNLPTAISAQVDYKIWKDFDINFIAYYAFQFKNNAHKVHDFSSLSITPSWDHKWFGVFFPMQYHFLYGWSYGTCVRLGPIIMGTDNLGSIIGNKTFKGTDFYFLLKIPIPFGPPKDKDKDGVSNKKDLCKNVPGVWEFKGCPDKDGDHVQDKDDKCPDVAGVIELQGCPDKDGDKIADAEDDCPEMAGTIEFKGCPDRDNDKIIDKNDSCPDNAGLAEFQGCPDTDSDGIADKEDNCPDVAGPKQFKGCPDKDGDGVLDKEDGCVDVPGPADNKGCPWPDEDKDGIYDKDDPCPTAPGTKETGGCPPLKVEEQKVIEKAFSSLEFASGKDVIKSTSNPSLNALAKLLKEHTADWTLKLSGHTDNQGAPEKNMQLSEKRVKAVKNYLVKKGVNPDKVVLEWFGQTKPIAPNDTEEGRQKNRRVEMKILFK